MRIRLDSTSPVPIYAQIVAEVRHAVAMGELGAGAQLPTVRQLAVDLRVNPNTVARAYADLDRAGVITTQQGRGTFVLGGKPPPADGARRERLREIARRAMGEAAALGFAPEELLQALRDRAQGAGPRPGGDDE